MELRDLRRLDNHFSHHEEPYILIRRHCVLISLGPHIRAIVQAEKLMILVFDLKDKAVEILEKLVDILSSELCVVLFIFECDDVFFSVKFVLFFQGLFHIARSYIIDEYAMNMFLPCLLFIDFSPFSPILASTELLFHQMPDLFHRSTSTKNEYTQIPFAVRAYGVLFSVQHSVLQKDYEVCKCDLWCILLSVLYVLCVFLFYVVFIVRFVNLFEI